jgi:hypothetical protein
MVKEGNRIVRRQIMSPNFLIKLSWALRKSVCYCMPFYLLRGKMMGGRGGITGFLELMSAKIQIR